MRKVVFFIVLCFIAGAARAGPVAFHPSAGAPDVIAANPDAIWSEPPDLNGLIGSSEQILTYGLESEIANDFVGDYGGPGYAVTWWGGCYDTTTPCAGITNPGFNLHFYENAGCRPGPLLYDGVVLPLEQYVGCQSGLYPMFKWGPTGVPMDLVVGQTYWFGVQARDHVYPPQFGRLAAAQVTGCESMFRSAYFGFPDWTPVVDVFGVEFDASQEIWSYAIDPQGACCFESGECRVLDRSGCSASGGTFLGDYTECWRCATSDVADDPAPSKRATTWGKIKGSYR